MVGSDQQVHVSAIMVVIIRLYIPKYVNQYNMHIQSVWCRDLEHLNIH